MNLLGLGAVTLWLLLFLKLFSSKAAASRRMQILEQRGDATRVKNMLCNEIADGRSQAAWCNAPGKTDNQKHNYYTLIVVACYYHYATNIACGYDVDPRTKPDATFAIGEHRYHVEMYLGKPHMGRSQVQARLKKYLGDKDKGVPPCEDTVLIVAVSEAAKQKLMEWSKLGEMAFFTTIQALIEDPLGEVWADAAGKKAAIKVPANVNGSVNDNGRG